MKILLSLIFTILLYPVFSQVLIDEYQINHPKPLKRSYNSFEEKYIFENKQIKEQLNKQDKKSTIVNQEKSSEIDKYYDPLRFYSISGGIIESDYAYECRVDFPFKKWILNGTIGYRTGKAGKSSVIVEPYKSIENTNEKGIYLKGGIGIKIGRKKSSGNDYHYDLKSSKKVGDYIEREYEVTEYDADFYNTSFLMLDFLYRPCGQFLDVSSIDNNDYTSVFIHGYEFYLSPKYRHLYESLGDDWYPQITIFDLGLLFTPDFKQFGAFTEFSFTKDLFFLSIGLGAIHRKDVPDDFKNPFPEEGGFTFLYDYSWSYPVKLSLGLFFAGGWW